MTLLDLLSDTTYRDRAEEKLDQLLYDTKKFPVARSQIHGLRQIARQQPDKVSEFARHQKTRADRKREIASEEKKSDFDPEINFWDLVVRLCDVSTSDWSVLKEGHAHLPEELRDEKIPENRSGMTPEERTHRNKLRKCQREWLHQWANEHIPAFFQRFCTQCLYRKTLIKDRQQRNKDNTYE